MIEIKNKTKTISAYFYFKEPESIGNVVIIHTLSFIANHFNVNIHNGILRKKEQGYFIVCYTGWISEVRGLHLMLESLYFSLMKDPKILFVIAGSDIQHTDEINKYCLSNAKAGLNDHIGLVR